MEVLIRELEYLKKATYKYLNIFDSTFSYNHCPEADKKETLGQMTTNDMAESALGGAITNVQRGGYIHLIGPSTESDTKQNKIFNISLRGKNSQKVKGLFNQFQNGREQLLVVLSKMIHHVQHQYIYVWPTHSL